MRNPSNRRLLAALLFFLLTVAISLTATDRAQASHCFRCGICRIDFETWEPCCKPNFDGGTGQAWTDCDDSSGTCVLSGSQC